MLWNVVYDFFVVYIFGGYSYNHGRVYSAFFGSVYDNAGSLYDPDLCTSDVLVDLNGFHLVDADIDLPLSIQIGNYFSLIATIITMVVIVVLACLFIKKIYNMCAHIIA